MKHVAMHIFCACILLGVGAWLGSSHRPGISDADYTASQNNVIDLEARLEAIARRDAEASGKLGDIGTEVKDSLGRIGRSLGLAKSIGERQARDEKIIDSLVVGVESLEKIFKLLSAYNSTRSGAVSDTGNNFDTIKVAP